MTHDVADSGATVGQLHLQSVDREDLARPDGVLGERVLGKGGVTWVVVPAHEVTTLGSAALVVVPTAAAFNRKGRRGVNHVISSGPDVARSLRLVGILLARQALLLLGILRVHR